jgi:serine/threonine protein kinase
MTKGTRCHRSPELKNKQCKNGAASDIYSAGVFLFILVSGGIIPHTEDRLYKGIDLFWLLNNDNFEFWQKHCEFQNKKPTDFSLHFRELFNGMTEFDPEERYTLQQIKNSVWFNGPVYTDKELKSFLQNILPPRF